MRATTKPFVVEHDTMRKRFNDLVNQHIPLIEEVFPWDLVDEMRHNPHLLLVGIRCPGECRQANSVRIGRHTRSTSVGAKRFTNGVKIPDIHCSKRGISCESSTRCSAWLGTPIKYPCR